MFKNKKQWKASKWDLMYERTYFLCCFCLMILQKREILKVFFVCTRPKILESVGAATSHQKVLRAKLFFFLSLHSSLSLFPKKLKLLNISFEVFSLIDDLIVLSLSPPEWQASVTKKWCPIMKKQFFIEL